MELIATKVFDYNCSICETMSRFDRSVFEGFPEIIYQEILFDDLEQGREDFTNSTLYRCLERYAVSSTYEIDFPTYVFLNQKGEYKGHLQGALTLPKLREGVKEILDRTSE